MRGDGTPFGWYKIVNITERSSFLDRDGVGRMVDFDLNLRLVKKTNAGRGDGGDAVSLGVIFDLKEFIKWLT
jgi:phage protein U